ncbi:MAG: hypothetical protein EPO22_13175 [Dehalococcoidia bacterium]|nr:MAG: hypothetical protein EPO22_13175 [Dehalococcoidia bacterium]
MNLKKNAKAKVGAVLASLVALLVGWGLVHQNAPVPVAADTASTADAAPAQNNSTTKATSPRSGASTSRSTAAMTPKRHVRTHVS